MKQKNNVAIFISGKGSNANNLMAFFDRDFSNKIALVFSTRQNDAIEMTCKKFGANYFECKPEMGDWSIVALEVCKSFEIDYIVLAGFLKKVTPSIIQNFPKRIINLHPSLLPKFGGKGMYGKHVHEAVIAAGELVSGITIHYVNEAFDEGEIIAQFKTEISVGDNPESLAFKIHELEMNFFPKVLAKLFSEN